VTVEKIEFEPTVPGVSDPGDPAPPAPTVIGYVVGPAVNVIVGAPSRGEDE
jgi:hypothetical protein